MDNYLREVIMENRGETFGVSERFQKMESTWIEITFTLDPEHYRLLWERVEDEHRTIPGFVRASVVDALRECK